MIPLPLHAFRGLPPLQACPQCSLPTYLQTVLDLPPIETVPVTDDAGIVYAIDLVATDGFYSLVVVFVALRVLLALRKSRPRRSGRRDDMP